MEATALTHCDDQKKQISLVLKKDSPDEDANTDGKQKSPPSIELSEITEDDEQHSSPTSTLELEANTTDDEKDDETTNTCPKIIIRVTTCTADNIQEAYPES